MVSQIESLQLFPLRSGKVKEKKNPHQHNFLNTNFVMFNNNSNCLSSNHNFVLML